MFRFVALALLIATSTLVPQSGRSQNQPRKADEEQLVLLEQEWVEAETRHNQGTLNRILDDNFLFVGPGGQLIRGKAAFIKAVQKMTFTSMRVVHDLILVNGDTAIIVDTFTTRQAGKQDDPPLRDVVTYIKRQGRWKAFGEHIGRFAAAN